MPWLKKEKKKPQENQRRRQIVIEHTVPSCSSPIYDEINPQGELPLHRTTTRSRAGSTNSESYTRLYKNPESIAIQEKYRRRPPPKPPGAQSLPRNFRSHQNLFQSHIYEMPDEWSGLKEQKPTQLSTIESSPSREFQYPALKHAHTEPALPHSKSVELDLTQSSDDYVEINQFSMDKEDDYTLMNPTVGLQSPSSAQFITQIPKPTPAPVPSTEELTQQLLPPPVSKDTLSISPKRPPRRPPPSPGISRPSPSSSIPPKVPIVQRATPAKQPPTPPQSSCSLSSLKPARPPKPASLKPNLSKKPNASNLTSSLSMNKQKPQIKATSSLSYSKSFNTQASNERYKSKPH